MSRFNLSEWALKHRSLVAFFMLMIMAAGVDAYFTLGRSEDPDFTVAGQGPLEALTKLGITEQVASKSEVELGPGAQGISPEATRNTVKTATRLANGDIDIGMLMLSDMLPEKDKYDIVGVLPRNVTAPVSVVGFISAHASDPAGAKALLDYLASSDAQAVWKEAGYGPPER